MPPWLMVAVQATLIRVAPVVAWPLGTNITHVPVKTPASSWTSLVTGATVINKDCSYHRSTDLDMAHGPVPEVNLAPGGTLGPYISQFLTALASSDLSLSTRHDPFCLSILPHPSLYVGSPQWCLSLWWQANLWFFLPTKGNYPSRNVSILHPLDSNGILRYFVCLFVMWLNISYTNSISLTTSFQVSICFMFSCPIPG